jgi:hypothetical protein
VIDVQGLWIGSELPELQQLSIRSFLAHGHGYLLYAYDNITCVPKGATLCDARSILPRESIFSYPSGFGEGSYSAFSNLFRYKLLLERGGWWVDTDLVCLRPFDFEDPFVFATEQYADDSVTCATCAIACPPRAHVLEYCVEVAQGKDKATLQWGQIGPYLLTDAVARFDLAAHRVPVEVFNPIHFFDFACMTEPAFDMSRLSRSHAVHFWNQMWKSNGANQISAPPDSLYGLLRERYLVNATV